MLTSDSDTLVVVLETEPDRLIAKIATSTASSRAWATTSTAWPTSARASTVCRVLTCCHGSSGTDGWPGTAS